MPDLGIQRVVLLVDRERVRSKASVVSSRLLPNSEMEAYIARALRELGYEVVIVAVRSGKQLIATLTSVEPDVVFNTSEHLRGRCELDAYVAAILEVAGVPYTGATPGCLVLTRDKGWSKSIAGKVGVPAPDFAMIAPGKPLRFRSFPAVVKPAERDYSDGISLRSFVRDRRELQARIELVSKRTADSYIVESFVPGRDLYVFALQVGGALKIRPAVTLEVNVAASDPRSMAVHSAKHDSSYRRRWGLQQSPAQLTREQTRRLHDYVRRLWPALQLRDYARFDFRLDESGAMYFIEANANPGFSPASRCDMWTWPDYVAAVQAIVTNAARRTPKPYRKRALT